MVLALTDFLMDPFFLKELLFLIDPVVLTLTLGFDRLLTVSDLDNIVGDGGRIGRRRDSRSRGRRCRGAELQLGILKRKSQVDVRILGRAILVDLKCYGTNILLASSFPHLIVH